MNKLKQILAKIRLLQSAEQSKESSIKLIKLPNYFKDISKLKDINESYPILKTNQNNVDYVVASAHITFSQDENKLHYNIYEPKLRGFDKLIKNTVSSLKKLKIDNLTSEQKYTYLNKQIRNLWADEKLNHEDKIKARYYVFRDVLGFGKLEPLLRDSNISKIQYNSGSSLYITHINSKYGNINTNITLTEDELYELKQKLSNLGKNFSVDIHDNNFSIKKALKHPLTVTDLANYETINPVLLGYLWLAIEEQQSVLITGETGTGKELIAEALHYRGRRCHKPLVKVNCSALSENLLESELFGHVKGSFSGAILDRTGRFQRANGGTIFLDEIGDISPRTQLQLLRVVQEKEFERVGDSTPIKVDVRIVAATNQRLHEKVRRGDFREDLYYRLKVVEVIMPPLRERKEDIPLLLNHFLNKFNKKLNKEIVAVSADVQKIFMNYSWPGNVRELEHTLEHAFIICRQNTITTDCLPLALKDFIGTKISASGDLGTDESHAILHALEKTSWNKARAARLLGMSRRTIYRKIKEFNIKMQRT